ncbi:NADH-quinone oxidoreductase subunit M [soil metagenome]
MIQVVLWLPFAAGLLAAMSPRRATPWVAVVGAGAALAIGIGLLASFDSEATGLQHPVDESWIPELGVRYSLGIDGLNIFLSLLTSVSWFAVTLWSTIREPDRPKTWFVMMGLAHTATLGAFLSQDLLLFVLFFDLMLIPFFFMFSGWGSEHPGRDWEQTVKPGPATIKMVVYTLVGSLLMLAGAIATGVIAGDGGTPVFSMSALAADPLGEGSQRWIFCFFALAFLVKMPAFLVHGWMADAYRTAPLPALALFSAVLSKVGAYGFLKVVLPIFPAATIQFQEVLLVVAVASILYGSIMAFTQTSARLVVGYSSIAQLGFITLGIFALRPDGADGAILQMVNHGLVTVPLMLLFVILVERVGSDDINRMGGLALRAPVMAALFLIVTMALLAIPGSSNFVGEFFILNGAFQAKTAFAIVASLGVAMAAYYALRLYQHAMHNRKRDSIESREIGWREGAVVGALVACIVALAFYPNLIVERTDTTVDQQLRSFEEPSGQTAASPATPSGASASPTPASQPAGPGREAEEPAAGLSDGEAVLQGVGPPTIEVAPE